MKIKFKENDPAVIDQIKTIFPEQKDLIESGINYADSMIWYVNRQYKLIYFNKTFEEYVNSFYPNQIKIGDFFGNIAYLFGTVFQKFWQSYCTKTLDGAIFSTDETITYKNKIALLEEEPLDINKEPSYLRINLSNLIWLGRVRGVCFMAFDISSHVAELKLKQQQKQYFQQLIERSSDITIIVDEDGEILYTSSAIKNYIENEIEDIIGLNIFKTFVGEEDFETFNEAFENAKKFPENSIQIKLKSKSPTLGELWFLVTINNFLDVHPLHSVVCSFRVIESQFVTEEKEMNIFPYEQLMKFSSELYLMINKEGKFCNGSSSIKEYLGFDDDQYIGQSLFNLLHPDCWEYAHKKLEEAIEKPKEGFEIKLQLVDRYGMKKWIKGTACNLLNVPGVEAIVGHFRDVGDELVIDKSEQTQIKTVQQYFLQSSTPIIICEPEFLRIIQINNSALKILGYERIDLNTKTALELLPSEYHANIQSLTTSETNALNMHGKVIANRMISKNSKIVWGEVVASLIKSNDCDLVALTIREKQSTAKNDMNLIYSKINNDIIVLKATMEAQERERVEIGKELHDNILQLIGTMNLYLDCLKKDEIEKYDSEEIIAKAENTSQLIIKEIRKVAHSLIKNYSEDVGLKLSIEDLLDSVSILNSFKTQLDYINVVDSDLSHDLKFNIYRIIQEQINNIIKHAHASKIVVRLSQAASILTLQIIDDGVGIDDEIDLSSGVGLTNIRNRVQLYNGELIFKTVPNNTGCMLMATFKLHTKEN